MTAVHTAWGAFVQAKGERARLVARLAVALLLAFSNHFPAPAQTAAEAGARQDGTDSAGTGLRPTTASRELSLAASAAQSAADFGPGPRGDPALDPEDTDSLDPRPRAGQRAAVTDGDLSHPAEPQPILDGLIETGEPDPAEDGTDPSTIDTRDSEDIGVFESPPAGYDPLLFQIEDIDPVSTDRRPASLARLDPYDPQGIRIGSFVYFPDFEIAGAATNNVLSAPDGSSDVSADVYSVSRLVSNWRTHALELRSTGAYSFHERFSTEDDRAWSVEGRGRLDIARRTNLQVLLLHDVRQEGRSAIDASRAGERPDVTTDEAALSLNHRFNRLSLQLRGTHTRLDYSDTGRGAMLVLSDERDVRTNEEALRATWELKPSFAVFAEAEANQRAFDAAALSDGIRRSSEGERYRLGIDFGATGTTLRGEASLGWGRQTPDDGRLAPVDAVLLDANLAWRWDGMTSLLIQAQTDIHDTTTAGSGGVVSHTAGVELRHAFRSYLIGSAGMLFSAREYASDPLEETELRTTLGAEYFVNREIILFGRYQHIAFESNMAAGDYHADDVRAGVRWRR